MDVPVDVKGCQNVILNCCPPYFLRHSLCTEPEVGHLAEAGQHIAGGHLFLHPIMLLLQMCTAMPGTLEIGTRSLCLHSKHLSP